MSTLTTFSFETFAVRTLGDSLAPLFVASDLAVVLGYRNAPDAVRMLDDDERISVEVETKGGKQTMTAVTESGLYALILKSRRPEAKRFRKWVTSEVLPAIRKQGRYECPAQAQLPPPMLTESQAYQIKSEVAKRCKTNGAHYQTVYRALKARYQVTKYTHIPSEKFEDALHFIQTMTLTVPEKPAESEHEPDNPAEKRYTVSASFLERQRVLVYYLRYLFREEIDRLIEVMRLMHSPHAGMLWDAIHNINLATLEENLESLGFPVRDLDCYQHWALTQAKAS